MSKQCLLVDPEDNCSKQAQCAQKNEGSDWNLFALCQEDSTERLVSPQDRSYSEQSNS